MKNVNIGVANFILSNKLKDSYFNNNLIEEKQDEEIINFLNEHLLFQVKNFKNEKYKQTNSAV